MRREILFVSSNFPPVVGGSSVVYEQLCRNAADAVVALGAGCSHDTGRPLARVDEHDATCGYPIHRLPYLRPPATLKRPGRLGRLLSFLLSDLPVMVRVLLGILVLVARYRVRTVCLGELVSLGWLILPLRYLLRRRVVIYTHGEEISQESDGTLARMRKLFLDRADAIVSVSRFCKSVIVSKYGCAPGKIFVVTNGVDLATFSPGPRDRSVFPEGIRDKRIVLAVSRLVDRKGHDRLIAAMRDVVARVPDAHCVIVGNGPLADRLAARVAEMRLEGCVSFMGGVPLETLVRLYRAADLFALPCRTLPDGDTEGFGLVFLEANACGAPVVAGAAGGTVEAVVDGESGFIVDGNDPREIASAIVRCLADPALARRLGEQGRRRAQDFGWNPVAQSFVALCQGRVRAPATAAFQPPPGNMAFTGRSHSPPYLLVTVDLEEEFSWTEFSRTNHSVRGVESLAAFHRLCGSFGVAPVYLVTHPVMQDEGFCAFLSQVLAEGSGEVGVHLHAWTTPPDWEHPNAFNSYQCNLPEAIERRKLETLQVTFEQRFGRRPFIHRAGRWGGSRRTADIAEDLGILVDLSPSAGYADSATGGPDFTNLDGQPFWSGRRRSVLTVPASSIRYLRGPGWLSTVSFGDSRLSSALGSVLGKGTAVRFSPEGQPLDRLKVIARQLVARGLPVVVLSLHSTSLYPGGNPYVPGPAASDRLLATTRSLLEDSVRGIGMRPITCRDLYAKGCACRSDVSENAAGGRVPADSDAVLS